jgi:hypothetical protein
MAENYMSRTKRAAVIGLSLVGLITLISMVAIPAFAPDRSRDRIILSTLFSEIRLIKGDTFLSSAFFMKLPYSGISQGYQSESSLADIRTHFIQEFDRLGWQLAAEFDSPAHTTTLTFKKDNLTAEVTYPGKAIAKPWDYLITLIYNHEWFR